PADQQQDEPPPGLWKQVALGLQLQQIKHPAIDQEISLYQSRGSSLARQLARGEPFLYHILEEVKKRGMPTEIALLPGVESGYQPHAYSRHGAAGLWQFMPATGRYFGLKQDWWHDARRDPVASTEAALDYLEKLHDRFGGDWLLAMAAYNAGGGTVARAMESNRKQGKPSDFWSLKLPRETRQYVPRILALSRIIAEPERYGVTLPEIANRPRFAKVEIGDQLDLKVAARLAGMTVDELFKLNAHFNRWATHPEGPHYLLLPIEKTDAFLAGLAKLPDEERLRWTRYRIRRGDTLSGIARKHGISVTALMQANHLSSHQIRAGADLIIPLSSSPTLVFDTSPATRKGVKYRVRKGDSLYRIARRFGVKVQDLKKWNRLASSRLQPGQTLTVIRTL
ncbi:MAG TPA: LysM peptidoglycan-binding domain-containing protein, partial [Chromatiaceae bacterium]|nr:LysM peptidoglycan-binding domain-containing protein [Chromatiaceae bacterium]